MSTSQQQPAGSERAVVRGQDNAYRRGLVLGLTMAEIMVLVLFLLLLALAASFAKYSASAKKLDEFESALRKAEIEPNVTTVTDVIETIKRRKDELDAQRQRLRELAAKERDADRFREIVQRIQGDQAELSVDEIRAQLERLIEIIKENETLRARLAQLGDQVRASGRGNEFPSCWVTTTSGIESIFELTLTANGVVIKEHNPQSRIDEKLAMPLAQVQYDVELPLNVFLEQTRPIYEWSVANRCRFYVIRFSSVSSAPIPLVNAISDMFYPDSRIQFRSLPAGPAEASQAE